MMKLWFLTMVDTEPNNSYMANLFVRVSKYGLYVQLMEEPYCGRNTRIEEYRLGQGPNVVLDLVEKSKIGPGCDVYFDNLFT